jgi:dynein heavy chain
MVVMLFSGFANAKPLSRKMVKLYKLSSEQLSQQDHYDFGMRAVKSVLVMAGALKRANPTLVEDVVLIRAFKDSNLPKFLVQDVELFMAIISDLFPGIFSKKIKMFMIPSCVFQTFFFIYMVTYLKLLFKKK